MWKCFYTVGISKIKFENLGNNFFLKAIIFQFYAFFGQDLIVHSSFELYARLTDHEAKRNAALLMKEKGIRSMQLSDAQELPHKTTF